MKKLITILFTFCTFFTAYADNYDTCKMRISSRYTAKTPQESRYKEILSQLNAAAETEYNEWLNTTVDGDLDGRCGTVEYKCTAGQKNKDCVPQPCWKIHDSRNSLSIQMTAKDQFIEEITLQECGQAPTDKPTTEENQNTNSDNSAQSNDTQPSAKQKRQAKRQQKADKKKSEQQQRDAQQQQNADKKKSEQQQRDAQQQQKADKKKSEKEAECKAKNPPMDIKKNSLGMWVCTDTQETINAREAKKQSNTTLKAFWDNMDDLEKAFSKRVRQLNKSGATK